MSDKFWVVIPAAGVGRRMAGDIPKQYLPLAQRTVIEWALAPFLARRDVAGIAIALARDDKRFATLVNDARVRTCSGGVERADSVLNALESLPAGDDDWVLVHDAARPCLHGDDLERLMAELRNDDVGGLLAAPVTDTLKSADAGRVMTTVPRDNLWRALTPQMFRFGLLQRALRTTPHTTDESGAIEKLGLRPKLVVGRSDNVKITVTEDLIYAETILKQRLG